MLRQVENLVKDKKIKVFELIRSGNKTKYRRYKKVDGEIASYWAHYLSISGKEFAVANPSSTFIRRSAIYTINYQEDIDEGMYIEDLCSGRIYIIKHIDRKEGYVGDLRISALETKEADNAVAEPEVENGD